MPKTTKERLIFTILMVIMMVYAMVCYNIAIDNGQITNDVFKIALYELPIMLPIAFILEFFIIEKLALKLAFKAVDVRKDSDLIIMTTIQAMIVLLMCPAMSFFAVILFVHPSNQLIAVWVQKTVMNFPMALLYQIFIAGPLVRKIYNKNILKTI